MGTRYGDPTANNNRTDETMNRTSFGGQARIYNDDGSIARQSGADLASGRYQGMGAAAANRAAYQADYGGYNASMGQADQARGSQGDALNLMRDAAYGKAPSQAQLLGQNMIDQSLQAQMAGAASAKGGSLAQAVALRNAANGAASFQQQGINQLSAMKADEMSRALGAYGGLSTGMRGQDYGAAGLNLQKVGQQQQNEQFQSGLNQQAWMGLEGMGLQVQQDQQQAALGQAGLDAGNWQHQNNLDAAATSRGTSTMLAGIGAGGSVGAAGVAAGGGGAAPAAALPAPAPAPAAPESWGGGNAAAPPDPWGSDIRMKTNVAPLSPMTDPSGDYVLKGGGMDVMGTIKKMSAVETRYNPAPMQQPSLGQVAAQRGRAILSDESAKRQAYILGREHESKGHDYPFLVEPPRPGERLDALGEVRRSPGQPRPSDMTFDERRNYRGTLPLGNAVMDAWEEDALTNPVTQGPLSGLSVLLAPKALGQAVTERIMDGDRQPRYVAEPGRQYDPGRDLRETSNGTSPSPTHAVLGYEPPQDLTIGPPIIRETTSFRRGPDPAAEPPTGRVIDMPIQEVPSVPKKVPPPKKVAPRKGQKTSSADPMGGALDAMQPFAYRYKPGYGENPNAQQVGPMAQPMARDPVASTAIVQDPRSGLLGIDQKNATKLALGGLGYLKDRQDATDRTLAALAARRTRA